MSTYDFSQLKSDLKEVGKVISHLKTELAEAEETGKQAIQERLLTAESEKEEIGKRVLEFFETEIESVTLYITHTTNSQPMPAPVEL